METSTAVVKGRRFLSLVLRYGVAYAPFLILALALSLRFYGVNWDQRGLFHPDERAILMNTDRLALPPAGDLGVLLDADKSPWNPHWFPYGSLPLYLLKGVQLALHPVVHLDLYDLRIPGRIISALADTLVVLMVFILGRRYFGRNTGLLAAGLTALSVINIQLSHFYAVDTILALFTIASIYFIISVSREGQRRDSVLAGLFIGLGLATKISLSPIILIYLMALALFVFSGDGDRLTPAMPNRAKLARAFDGAVLAAITAFVVFFISEPYALLDWPIISFKDQSIGGILSSIRGLMAGAVQGVAGNQFVRDVTEQSGMVRRIFDYPYTRQYVNTPDYWYHVQQLAVWGLGIPLGIAAWLGLPFGALRAAVRRRKSDILMISWVVLYFFIVGSFQVKFLRYMLPITPFLILYGSQMVMAIVSRISVVGPKAATYARIGVAVLVGVTAFYALAYVSIYSRPHPATSASQWIRSNVPAGASILKEHWEEGLPNLGQYKWAELPMYEDDTPQKTAQVSQMLAGADYLVFYSQRLYATIPRLKERYPVSSEYYRLLFSEAIGYRLVHFDTSYPGLLGVSLMDDTFSRPGLPTPYALQNFKPSAISIDMGFADESFTVYDHPLVMIFKNEEHFSADALQGVLNQAAAARARGEPPPQQSKALGLVYSQEDAQVQQQGGTWSKIVDVNGWTNRLPVVAWLLLVEGMALLVLPLTFFIFRPLPDRGYLFSKILGLLLTCWLVWMMASLKWMAFSRLSITAALAVLFLLSLIVRFFRGQDIVAFIKSKWRLLALEECLFLAAFLAFVLVRMANPDLWHPFRGGEKPMDFAYLNAVLRSTYMPPYDPWYAGGFLNYYYMGQFFVATLIKGTGIVPSVAYNLAVPLFFALTAAGAFAVVYNLAEVTRRRIKMPGPSWTPVAAGFAAVLLVVALGNLDGLVQVAGGIWRTAIVNQPFGSFDFWRSTRLMPPDPPGFEIDEFPFFTFLFSDLHAHMMALPFTILALGVGLTIVVSRLDQTRGRVKFLTEAGQLVLLSLVIGALRTINTWDYPTYLIIAVALVTLAEYFRQGGIGLALLVRIAFKAALVYLLATLFFLPYIQSNQSFYDGFPATTNRTALWQFLLINGFFVFIGASFLLYEVWPRLTRISLRTKPAPLPAEGDGVPAPSKRRRVSRRALVGLSLVILGLALLVFVAGVLAKVFLDTSVLKVLKDYVAAPIQPPNSLPYDPAVFVGLLLIAVFVWGLKSLAAWTPEAPFKAFVAVLIGVALGLALGIEFARVNGDIDRMNTVFKFYLQIWVLLALASAYLLWRMTHSLIQTRKVSTKWGLWLSVLAVLAVGIAIYPVLGTQVRLRDRFQTLPLTLDGAAFMKQTVYHDQQGDMQLKYDYDAILWIQQNIQGSPVMLEGSTPSYRWGGRISIYTGLPSVVGWQWHQTQQRFDYRGTVDQRIADVNLMYSTTSNQQALNLIQKYGVKYIYVGELERLYYPAQGIAKFEELAGSALENVYQNDNVTIYRVK